ncbi:kinase-like domain-containing protein [Rhizophagus clarus]|uniref:Kinase-like domain-containing protein n=1 Tax=Rhizophagus clarus TaxID=94130 RepID=A0A8H3QCU4_9GLOM|nr:kinase-like domain-containing protein [Rhizophagus clarus]
MTYLCENCDYSIDIDKNPYIKWSIWLDGPLNYDDSYDEYQRMSNEKVILKCLDNSQNNVNEFFLNEAKSHIIGNYDINSIKIYGISQEPNTKDYIMVLSDCYCEKCAIWLDGPLKYNKNTRWERVPNEKVALEFLHNSNNIINKILHKAEQIYGISRNPDTKEYVIVFKDFYCRNCVVEWIPYDQLINIKEINNSSTQYTAIWANGPLQYEKKKQEYERLPNGKVALKCLGNLQTITNEFLNKVRSYFIEDNFTNIKKVYGLSKNPDITKEYLIVFRNCFCKKYEWCEPCKIDDFANWTSGNKKIDNYIQEMQLKIKTDVSKIFEWIPYNQFKNVTEISKSNSASIYSAIWINSPLQYKRKKANKEVTLKCLYNSQNMISELLSEAKSYSIDKINGISQHPDTKDYIIVLQDHFCKKCGNQYTNTHGKHDSSIQYMAIWMNGPLQYEKNKQEYERLSNKEVSLKCLVNSQDMFSELLNEVKLYSIKSGDTNKIKICGFNKIKEIIRGDFTAIYSAIWMNGPLEYKRYKGEYERISNRKVILKYIYYSQININEFLNIKVKLYSINKYDNNKIYGISQNPNTKDFIIILQDFYFEWIPYNQFINIKEVGKGGFATVHSAIWIDGPLKYEAEKQEYNRSPNMKVALKCLYNSQNITNKFLNEIKAYSISLKKIHDNKMVHHDFHIGNILTLSNIVTIEDFNPYFNQVCISDMGLCGEVDNIDETKIYGVMPYVAPEVLRENRPIASEIEELIKLISNAIDGSTGKTLFSIVFKKQFEEAEEYRKANILSIENDQSTTHPQACYTSRLLNPFTKDLSNNSSVEVIDFTDEQ